MAKAFALATTSSGLSVPFAIGPSADKIRYDAPQLLGVNLNNEPVYSGYEGRTLEWNALTNAQWSSLLSSTGTTSEHSSTGFIRVPDWEFSGSTETWGDYACLFWRPTQGMWRQGKYRTGVVLKVVNMIRIANVG